MARFGGSRSPKNYRGISQGLGSDGGLYLGITLGVIAGLILIYALCIEARRYVKNRIKRAKLHKQRKMQSE